MLYGRRVTRLGTWATSIADAANLQESRTTLSIDLWRTRPASTNALSHIIDRMFEQTFVPFGSEGLDGGSSGFKSLPVNVWETDDRYHVSVLAPGLDAQNIDVSFHGDTLAIEGTLAFHASEGAKVVWQEFNPGPTRF